MILIQWIKKLVEYPRKSLFLVLLSILFHCCFYYLLLSILYINKQSEVYFKREYITSNNIMEISSGITIIAD